MNWKLSIACFISIFILSACSVSQDAASKTPADMKEDPFAAYTKLSSDGLLHNPYGWDNLYGSKEVPEIWWQREPRDPIAGQQTYINISVGKVIEEKEIWIEWTLDGQLMEPIECQHRANVRVDGIEKAKYVGVLPETDVGSNVEYTICAGESGNAEKSLGTFRYTVSDWKRVSMTGYQIQGSHLILSGMADKVPVQITAQPNNSGNVILEISNSGQGYKAAFPVQIPIAELYLTANTDGGIFLSKDGEVIFAIQAVDILTDGEIVSAIRLTASADGDDRFYGFGMKYDTLNQRGNIVDTYCVNWYKDQKGETYTPVPYYFVPDKYGLYVDSTHYSQFDMCSTSHENSCVIEIHTGATDQFSVPIHLFTGTNAEIASSYASVAGSAELPPIWAFGPWISANEWNKQSEITEQLKQTLALKIPTSVIVIEAWSDEETFYTFNDSKFETMSGSSSPAYSDFSFGGRWPNPKEMVEELHANGVKCLLWQIPVLKYSTNASAQSVRDQTYAADMGYVLRYEDGGIYRLPAGTWFGNSLLVDFTNPDATEWFLNKRRYLIEEVGVDGFKTDGGEFVWGRSVTAFDGKKGNELRNAYPDLYAQAFYDFGKEMGRETITFSRAGGSSMQTHPLCWIGDQSSDFAAFQSAIRATLSASMSGIPFVAWDIAGFSGDIPSSELYQRSVAQAAFSPVMQLHSESAGDPIPSQARTPWNMAERKGDTACLDTYRYYANLRMNLLPYIYTEAKWSAETGEPMMRSMAYAFPEEHIAEEYEFQYLFGRNMLVAPVTKPNAKSIDVYLPEGIWYNIFTGERYLGGKTWTVSAKVEEIPVFVREGTIIPVNIDESGELATYVGNTADTYQSLSYLVFPGAGNYVWYDYVNECEITASWDGLSIDVNGRPFQGHIIRMGGIS